MAKNVNLILDFAKLKTTGRKARTPYKPVKYFNDRITAEERVFTKRMFDIIQDELEKLIFDVNVYTQNMIKVAAPMIGEIHFSVDAGTKNMIQAVNDSSIRYGKDKFLSSVFK